MKTQPWQLTSFLIILCACGPTSSGHPGIEAGHDAAPDADDSGRAWALEQVTQSPGTISHNPTLAVTPSGVRWLAFVEPDMVALTDEDIFTTSRSSGGIGSTPAQLTADTRVQNAFPALVADGETLHLVWNGFPDGINDIFYSTNPGSGFTSRVNLTKTTESGMGRNAYAPSLALGPNGKLAIAYLSSPGNPGGAAEVRLAQLANGALTAAPITVIPSVGTSCFSAQALYDQAGVLHVVADCGQLYNNDIYYTDNASGSFSNPVKLPDNDWRDDSSPRLALDPDGTSIHVAWTATVACGTTSCAVIEYSKRENGQFRDPVAASSPTGNASYATLAVNRDGHIYVGFNRASGSGSDIFVAQSDNDATFVEQNITPGTDATTEWMPTSMQIDPQNGLPLLAYVQIVPDSDPVNSEIWQASLLPVAAK